MLTELLHINIIHVMVFSLNSGKKNTDDSKEQMFCHVGESSCRDLSRL